MKGSSTDAKNKTRRGTSMKTSFMICCIGLTYSKITISGEQDKRNYWFKKKNHTSIYLPDFKNKS